MLYSEVWIQHYCLSNLYIFLNGITAKYNILQYVVAIPIMRINDGVFSLTDNSTEKKPICSFCTHDKVLSQFYPKNLFLPLQILFYVYNTCHNNTIHTVFWCTNVTFFETVCVS